MKIIKFGLVLLLQFIIALFMLVKLVTGQIVVWLDSVVTWLGE